MVNVIVAQLPGHSQSMARFYSRDTRAPAGPTLAPPLFKVTILFNVK